MTNLLHLSDLHFGDQDATARAQRAGALDLLINELAKLEPDWNPHVLVISGDLSWRGMPAGYTELADWLSKKLFPVTGLTAAECVICPGNHDLDRKKARSLLDRTADPKRADEVLRPEDLEDGFARPFHAFVKFAQDFGIPAPLLHGEPNYLAGMRELRGIRFVCLNSAWFCRDSQTDRGQLWLGLPQLQSILGSFQTDAYDEAPVTVAVLHHPQDWLANSECNAYDNRPNSYAYMAERSHLILSGHTHGAVERATRCFDRARLFLGGASYDNHSYRNNFSLLRIDPDARAVIHRPWELDPQKPEWEPKKQRAYSLRTEKSGPGAPSTAKYLAWLRDRTQTIDLHQLKVGPEDAPRPAIDLLYIQLKTAASAMKDPKLAAGQEALAAGEAMERAQPRPLEEVLQNRRLVIEGKPGGGKTTFVRWIAWMLCRLSGPPAGFPVRGFPLLIRISQLDQHIARTLESRRPGDPAQPVDARWIGHFLASQGWGLDEEFFRQKLAEEETVLLLDGLDEAASQTRREKIVQMFQLAAAQYRCRMVVTTRPGAHEGRTTLAGFAKASIDDLDDKGIEGFLRQWCLWLKRGEEAAALEYYAELRPAIAVPSIHILARNPLMLTALAVLHLRRHRLPEQRAQLYEQIMDWLADQAVERRPELWRKDDLLGRFGRLALAMQEWKGGQKLQIGIDTAAALLTPPDQSIRPTQAFLEQAQIDSGIVTLRGAEIAFWHRSFQEYLAARTLAGLPDAKLGARAIEFLYSPEGREVLPLLAGHMAGPAKERLDDLFDILTRDAVAQKTLDRQAHAAGVLGNMLSDLTPRYDLTGPARTQFAQLRQTVMAIFEKGRTGNIGLKTRVAAAEALDQASQSRLRAPRHPDYWVEIPGGKFTIGDPGAFQSLPVRSVSLPAFRIGRFPVTVWEYGAYLDDTGADAPRDWEEQARHPGRPVISVTWHDAQRYCEWAGAKWAIKCALATEQQWELAARGPEGRIYPWGDQDPDERRVNFNNLVGEPTPVGMFPEGNTPDGISDLAGNVWEWTRSAFNKNTKVVRGASFGYNASILRAAVRDWGVPGGSLIGFRCVRE